MNDLHRPDAAGYSFGVFIGREKMNKLSTWLNTEFHKEPRMVVDVAVNYQDTMTTREVFFISPDKIERWDVKSDTSYVLPHGTSLNTRLITEILDYAVKLPKISRGRI